MLSMYCRPSFSDKERLSLPVIPRFLVIPGWVSCLTTDTYISDLFAQYIIYGASTSVGLFGIQVAKSLGYKVLGVCSPHSFDLAKSYGADATVSYHDQEKAIVEALKITDGGAEYALDTISEGDTFRVTIGMMGKKGKQLNCILAVPDEVKQINPNLKVEWSLMYTLFGVVSLGDHVL